MKKLLFAAVALAFATPASAVTVDPYEQLSGPTPSVGNFVFGTVNSTGVLTPFNALQRPCDGFSFNTCARNLGQDVPVVAAPTQPINAGNFIIPGDQLFLHPSNEARVGLSFVAALAGAYKFVGEFSVLSPTASGIGTGALVLNGVTLLPTEFLASGSRFFDFTQSLGAGDTVTFFVDPAGSFISDSTGLSLQVTNIAPVVGAVPEPSTWLMMILGFGLVGGTLRSRRRAATGLAAA